MDDLPASPAPQIQPNSNLQPQITELSPEQRKNLFYRRFLASSIDALIIYFIPLAYLMYTLYTNTPAKRFEFLINIDSFVGNLFFIAAAIVAFFYNTIALAKYGTTIGKHFLGIKVVSAKGQTPTFFQAATRELIKWLPSLVFPLAFYVVAGWAYYDRFGQGFHDKLAKTYFFESRAISRTSYNLSRALVALVPLLFTLLIAPLILSVSDLPFSKGGFKELLSLPVVQQKFAEEDQKTKVEFQKAASAIKNFVSKNNQVPTDYEYNQLITDSQFGFYYRLCDSLGKDNTSLLDVPLTLQTPEEVEKGMQHWLIYRSKVGKVEEVVAKGEPPCLRDEDKQNDLKEAINRLDQQKSKSGSYPSKGGISLLDSLGITYNEFYGYEQCLDSNKPVFVLALILEESNKLLIYRSAGNSYQTTEVPKRTVQGSYPPLSCP